MFNLNSAKENESSSTLNGGTAVLTSISLALRFKSVQVRNEVMRFKILKGNIPVDIIFPNLPDLAENKVFLDEFLAKEVHKLLILVRARAKARNYERVWVRNQQIRHYNCVFRDLQKLIFNYCAGTLVYAPE